MIISDLNHLEDTNARVIGGYEKGRGEPVELEVSTSEHTSALDAVLPLIARNLNYRKSWRLENGHIVQGPIYAGV